MLDLIKLHLDWVALAFTVYGTVIWAHNGSQARYASLYWFVASCLWMLYAYLNGLPALTLRDATNVALYVYAGYCYFLRD